MLLTIYMGLNGIDHIYKLYLRHMTLSLFRNYGNVKSIYLIVYPMTLQFMYSLAWLMQSHLVLSKADLLAVLQYSFEVINKVYYILLSR